MQYLNVADVHPSLDHEVIHALARVDEIETYRTQAEFYTKMANESTGWKKIVYQRLAKYHTGLAKWAEKRYKHEKEEGTATRKNKKDKKKKKSNKSDKKSKSNNKSKSKK